ncbi:hypothetical protein TWF718_001247 [Orbilia javanica]|uniref:Uncharacterized protein n=1 Tax=Orbilia javanica TaxID=47235 RepID=A0AAN8RGS9_9PEZI
MSEQEIISIFPALISEDLISLSPPPDSPDVARSPSPFIMPSPIGEGESPLSTALNSGHDFQFEGFLDQYEDVHDGIHRAGHIHASPPSRASSGLASQIFSERIFQHFQESGRGPTEVPESEISGNTESSDLRPTGQELAIRLEQLYLQAMNPEFEPADDSDRFEYLTASSSFENFRDDFEPLSEPIRGPTPPLPPPGVFASEAQRGPQMNWEALKEKMRHAYKEKLDNGILDTLTVQNTDNFIFFDVKYTHIGDYLEIGFARTPVQICLMKYSGGIIYQANLAMFDPRNGREVLSMIQWLDLILDYQCTGAMSRRWYNIGRMNIAISNMRGYFWSTEVPRRTIHQIKNDLKAFNFRHKVLFTHDGSLRPYDVLRKLLPEATLPPRLITMSSHKLIKIVLPDMPRDLHGFFYHLVDLNTFDDPSAPVLHKYIATDDTTYIRQIFSFFISAWESFQSEEDGRPREDAPERLVEVWEGIPPDSPCFEPVSESDGDEDMGLTLSDVEALGLEAEQQQQQEEDLISMEEAAGTPIDGAGSSRGPKDENFNPVVATAESKDDEAVTETYNSAEEGDITRYSDTSIRSDLWDYD